MSWYNGAYWPLTPVYIHTVRVTLLGAETKRDDSCPANTDSSSATAVGLFLGGVVAGALGVLLIVGIVCGACRLRRTKRKWVHKEQLCSHKHSYMATYIRISKFWIHVQPCSMPWNVYWCMVSMHLWHFVMSVMCLQSTMAVKIQAFEIGKLGTV